MNMARIIRCARGEVPADLLLTGGRIINVFTGDITRSSVAVAEGRIVGLGDYNAEKTLDVGGRYICPGFIDAHVHIESAMTAIPEFARALLPRGVTTVIADPHEIANVLGADGIRYMLDASEGLPLNVYFTLPSCVPATDMETAGAVLSADVLMPFLKEKRIVALGEMMNYPGVLANAPDPMGKIDAALQYGKPVDGHSPGLSGHDLNAYLSAGISSDHECTTAGEALEKVTAGMHIMIREGTGARNLDDLLSVVNERNHHRMMWCTDDRHPHDLLDEGGIDAMVRRAITGGLDPVIAIRMATLNPARYFGLHHLGAIAPGRQADLVVFSDLKAPRPEMVFTQGIQRSGNGVSVESAVTPMTAIPPSPMAISPDRIQLEIPAKGGRIRVIELAPGQIMTRQSVEAAALDGDLAVADISRDLLKIAVVERYTGKGGAGIGFVRGFGLKDGAIAASVAHDSHNLIVVGTSDEAMIVALRGVVEMGGGLVAVRGDGGPNGASERLPLPIAGLMSAAPMDEVRRGMDRLNEVARMMGCPLDDPFMALSFLALPVIPSLKITDKGLVDVDHFRFVDLFVD